MTCFTHNHSSRPSSLLSLILNHPQWLLAVLLCIALGSCGHKATLSDYNEADYTPRYASLFEIKKAPGCESVLLDVRNPWQGANEVSEPLLILRGDEEAPDGFEGQVIRGEAKRIVCMSSSHVAMLDALGETDRVVGVSGLRFITNPQILERGDGVVDVGYEGNIDYEALVGLEPDLVLLYGVNGASTMETKLHQLGIPYAYVCDYLEENPLGKAEWMVAIAEIVGKRPLGERIYAEIPQAYDALCQVAEEAAEAEGRPSVMLNTPYGDMWYMPSQGSYIVKLLQDAGAQYIYNQHLGNQSQTIDMETAYLLASQSDYWLNVSAITSLADLRRQYPKFADTPPVVNGHVYNTTLRSTPGGGNDYWESGVVNPQLVLQDLIKIFHPSQLQDRPFTYYKPLE